MIPTASSNRANPRLFHLVYRVTLSPDSVTSWAYQSQLPGHADAACVGAARLAEGVGTALEEARLDVSAGDNRLLSAPFGLNLWQSRDNIRRALR